VVDGVVVMKDRKMVRLDEEEVIREARERARRLTRS